MWTHPVKLVLVLLSVISVISLGGCGEPTFPFYDDFSDPSTKSKYRIEDTGAPLDNFDIVNDQAEIKVARNQDLWGVLGGQGDPKKGALLALIDAPAGEYEVQAFVTAANTDSHGKPQAVNTQVGLFVFWDIDNWLFFGLTSLDFTDIDNVNDTFDGLMVTATIDGHSSEEVRDFIGSQMDSLNLRVRKHDEALGGERFTVRYRFGGSDDWKELEGFDSVSFPPDLGAAEVGMGVKSFDFRDTFTSNPSNEGLGLFDNFEVKTL